MLNEEQANKTELLHKIQFAVETIDVSKFKVFQRMKK